MLELDLELKTKAFEKGIKDAGNMIKSISQDANKEIGNLNSLLNHNINIIKKSLSWLEQINEKYIKWGAYIKRVSKSIEMSAGSFSSLSYAAEKNSIKLEIFSDSIVRLYKNIYKARDKTSELFKTFDKLR